MAKVIFEDGTPILRSDWWPEDFHAAAEDLGVELSDEQLVEAMELVARGHDATVGVNWDVISYAVESITKGVKA